MYKVNMFMYTKENVLLGMSGGTDSSVSAFLLQQAGYNVIGVTFRFYEHNNDQTYLQKASNMAKHLHMPHYIVDKRKDFQSIVIENFTNEYLAGRTPFPCAHCNTYLKWDALLEQAHRLDCPHIATGHYVNTITKDNYTYLSMGKDIDKDQTFFLWGMPQEAIERAIFPLGNLLYHEVQNIATSNQLPVKQNKNSVGACFCPTDYRPLLKKIATEKGIQIHQGIFTDEIGNFLGKHEGYPFYTIGQRRGLGLQHISPLYVKKINRETNSIIVAPKESCYQTTVHLTGLLCRQLVEKEKQLTAKVQYKKQACTATLDMINTSEALVTLHEPTLGMAPGQSIVLYDGDILIAGGIIQNAW